MRAPACADCAELLAFVKRQFDETACICHFRTAGFTDMPCDKCAAQKLIAKHGGGK